MGQKIQSVKGTRDLLPPETAIWAAVERVARRVFGNYGFDEIRTPVLEETDLFVRSVGESTDIVGKEMYTFPDKKGRSLTLRPESTASVCRAFVQHGFQQRPLPARLYYIGPHFRYERPQKGRYRQFHQIGAEIVGDPGPWADAELLLMLVRFLSELDFTDLVVQINTVGDEESRSGYREALKRFLEPHRERLGEDSRRRLETNPLRILDTKVPVERELLAGAPTLADHLNRESREHFRAVIEVLDRFGVDYSVEPQLVRGLDYYTRTVFEITSRGLGAQDAIVGGGRYDSLVSDLGGPELPSLGFAIGQDRLIDVLPESFRARSERPDPILVLPLGPEATLPALELAEHLRGRGLAATVELSGRSVKAALRRADRMGIRHVLLLGEAELAKGEATLKDLTTGEQETLPADEVARRLEEAEPGRPEMEESS